MSKIVVFGCNGQMGFAICEGFCRLGYDVVGADKLDSHGSNVPWLNFISCDIRHPAEIQKAFDEHKISATVSALPYFLNERVADISMRNNIPYFDLGGKVNVSEKIHQLSETFGVSCFTDLGLAPGWVNIVAEEAYQKLSLIGDVETIAMYVGGLPQEMNPPLNYKVTWSTEGLLNEYRDDCLVLKDGEIVTEKGMDDVYGLTIPVSSFENFKFETFNTSGGASHILESMQKRGVQNCKYQTIRHPGHRDAVKMMLDSMDYYEVGKVIEAQSVEGKDFVIMHVWASLHNIPVQYEYNKIVFADEEFSAMQLCTAFPLVTAVNQFLSQGFPEHKKLTYEDIRYGKFNAMVNALIGIDE